MALTVTVTKRGREGRAYTAEGTITFDTSLLAGGETITPRQLGFSQKIETMDFYGNHGYVVKFDHVNSKINAYRQTAATSALVEAATIDLSAIAPTKYRARGF